MEFVALLRGINVGGKNKVPMHDLRETFEALGFEDVRTYLNTGNVIFSATAPPARSSLEGAIEARFGFPVKVLVLDGDTVAAVAASIPEGWVEDAAIKCDILFLWDEIDDPAILEVLPLREGVDKVTYVPGAVIRRVERKHASKSRMTRLVGTDLYRSMTVRNANTVRKLAALLEG